MPRVRGVVNDDSNLKDYVIQLRRNKIPFRCPRCQTLLSSKEFQDHCARHHGLNPKLCCVWCWGKESWNSGEKYSRADHLKQCWGIFLEHQALADPAAPVVFLDNKWRCKIKHLSGIPQGLALPVSRDLRPRTSPAPSLDSNPPDRPIPPHAFLHLGDGDVMYFEHTADPKHWLDQQLEGGNQFHHAVGEKYFTFNRSQQRLLKATQPTRQLNAKYRAEIAELKTRVAQLEAKLEKEVTQRKAETSKLLKRNAQLETKLARIQKQTPSRKRSKFVHL